MADLPIASALEHHRTRHDQRREATDRKIMDATLHIIIARGIGAVTIEEVARQSGVAKTTIYRRYRNADDLLAKLSVTVGHVVRIDDLAPSRSGLRELLERIVGSFDGEMGLKSVGVVLSSENDYVHAIAENVIDPVRRQFAAFLERGVADGTFRAGVDGDFLFNTIIGSMLATQALSSTDGPAWAARMAALLWPSLCAGN